MTTTGPRGQPCGSLEVPCPIEEGVRLAHLLGDERHRVLYLSGETINIRHSIELRGVYLHGSAPSTTIVCSDSSFPGIIIDAGSYRSNRMTGHVTGLTVQGCQIGILVRGRGVAGHFIAVQNVTLKDNSKVGLGVQGESLQLEMANVLMLRNRHSGLAVRGKNVALVAISSTSQENGQAGVYLQGRHITFESVYSKIYSNADSGLLIRGMKHLLLVKDSWLEGNVKDGIAMLANNSSLQIELSALVGNGGCGLHSAGNFLDVIAIGSNFTGNAQKGALVLSGDTGSVMLKAVNIHSNRASSYLQANQIDVNDVDVTIPAGDGLDLVLPNGSAGLGGRAADIGDWVRTNTSKVLPSETEAASSVRAVVSTTLPPFSGDATQATGARPVPEQEPWWNAEDTGDPACRGSCSEAAPSETMRAPRCGIDWANVFLSLSCLTFVFRGLLILIGVAGGKATPATTHQDVSMLSQHLNGVGDSQEKNMQDVGGKGDDAPPDMAPLHEASTVAPNMTDLHLVEAEANEDNATDITAAAKRRRKPRRRRRRMAGDAEDEIALECIICFELFDDEALESDAERRFLHTLCCSQLLCSICYEGTKQRSMLCPACRDPGYEVVPIVKVEGGQLLHGLPAPKPLRAAPAAVAPATTK